MKTFNIILTVALLVLPAGIAGALPINVPDFSVDPSGSAFEIFPIGATQGLSSNIAAAPTLTFGVTDQETSTSNTMQMNWTPVNEEESAQAGWALRFLQDPDLTNQQISLSINPPGQNNPRGLAAITHLEIIIRDINGNSAGGWGFNTDQSGVRAGGAPPVGPFVTLGNDPFGTWRAPNCLPAGPALPPPPLGPLASLANDMMQVVTINIFNGPVAGSATIQGGPLGQLTGPNYLLAGNGGLITQAQQLEFYENGVLAGSIQVPAYGAAGLNNYWDHITVTPEPATLGLLGIGTLALIRRR